MTITRSQIQSWDPSVLAAIADNWESMAVGIEDLFDRYKSAVRDVNGGHWEGVTAEAALHRADSDRRAAVRVAEHLERAATIAVDGYHAIDSPLSRARTAITGAERAGFVVSEDLTVSAPDITTADDLVARARWQREISDAANAAYVADIEVKNQLAVAGEELRLAVVAPAALGSEQGSSDGQQLRNDPSHLTPEQVQRIAEGGVLTSAQLTALQLGDTVPIPASQMEYLNALARSLDDKSPRDIEATLNQLPPDARHGVANALQLLSTPKVTASVATDSEVPVTGAAQLLPQRMYRSLTRPDLATKQFRTHTYGGFWSVEVNGVADNQAVARIADMGSPGLKHGTGLDAAVFDAASKYLGAQVAWEQDPDRKFVAFSVDGYGEHADEPLTEAMFSAVADDRAMVAAALSDKTGQAFLSDVFLHEWSDDGRSVSELFHVDVQDALATPGDRVDELRATQSGDIAESVARFMSERSEGLLNLPDDHGMSVGERNPDLLVNLADDLAPYYSTLAGSESIAGVGHFDTAKQLADMYSVLATNPDAGVRAAIATYAQENALSALYGLGDSPSTYAQIAGQMQHGLEAGTASAMRAMDAGDTYRANWEQAVNQAHWGATRTAIQSVVNMFPGGGLVKDLIGIVGYELRPHVLGVVDPTVHDPTNAAAFESATTLVDSNMTAEFIANGVLSRDPSIIDDPAFADFRDINSNGDPYFNIENLRDQAEIRDLLYSRYGIDIDDWYTNYALGMHTGTIAAAG